MLFYYPILIHEEDGFWAEFPDLDGCNAQGDTLNELLDDAKGALETHIYCILIDGEHLNKPSDPRSIPTDEKSFVALISADVDINKENRSVKKTLTVPYWMNEQAEQQGLNFSKTLQEAILQKLIS